MKASTRSVGFDALFMATVTTTPRRAHGTLFHTQLTEPRGDQLLPLAMLRERYPDLHARHRAKYAGREHRLRERVIPLDCAWSDVVFFSPFEPTPLFDAARSAGRRVVPGPVRTLDAALLDPERCCVRLMRVTPGAGTGTGTADPGTEDDYLPLTTATLRAVREVTHRALERLRNLGPHDPLLLFGDVPHVLHRGPVPFHLFRPWRV
jgi:hypothetical protein